MQYKLFTNERSIFAKSWDQNYSRYSAVNNMDKIICPHKRKWLEMLDTLIQRAEAIKQQKKETGISKNQMVKNLSDYDKIIKVFQTLKDPFGLPLKQRLIIYSAFISEDDSMQITYLNTKRKFIDEENRLSYKIAFDYKNRLRCKFITFLKKFNYLGLPEKLLPAISDIWINTYNDNFKTEYKIHDGAELVQIYRDLIIPNNCMKHNPNGCLDFYVSNSNKIKLLVGYINNQPVSRALIWQVQPDKWFLDRNYTNGSGSIPRWLVLDTLKNGDAFPFKTNDGTIDIIDITEDDTITPGTLSNEDYSLDFVLGDSCRIPYMDSFHYGSCINGDYNKVCLSTSSYDYDFEVNSTDGFSPEENDNRVWDDITEELVDAEYAVELTDSRWTHIDNATDTYDGYIDSEQAAYLDVEYKGYEYCHENEVCYCEITEKSFHEDMSITIEYDCSSYTSYEDINEWEVFEYFEITTDEYKINISGSTWSVEKIEIEEEIETETETELEVA